MVLICCITAVVIRKSHKSCKTQQVIYDIPTVKILESNESRQANTSLTSSAPLPPLNPVVQTFNGGTSFNIEDQLAGVAHVPA